MTGCKCHIISDTNGFLVHAIVHSADITDRDGATMVLANIHSSFPWLRHVFALTGYASDVLRKALAMIGNGTLEFNERPDACTSNSMTVHGLH